MGLLEKIRDRKTRDVACVAAGMTGVLAGRKVIGLGLFAKGLWGLERRWREERRFEGTFAERWAEAERFYEATHRHPVNRALHVVGIPMIVGGAAGLLAFRPYRPLWAASAGWFTAGWVLNFVGHGLFEKNAPAFADDPLSFVAGPAWDLRHLRARLGGDGSDEGPAEPAPPPAEAEAPYVLIT